MIFRYQRECEKQKDKTSLHTYVRILGGKEKKDAKRNERKK